MARGKVFTVEELQQRQEFIESIPEQMEKGVEVVLEAPEVIVADVKRMESPPVSVVPTVQAPPETLSTQKERPMHELSVAEILAAAEIHPVQELIDAYLAKNEDETSPDFGKFLMPPFERRKLMQELMKYTNPQLKSVEHLGNGGDNRIMVVLQMPDGTQLQQEVEARGKPIDI